MDKTRKWATLAASAIAIGTVAFLVGRAWAGGIPAMGALTYSGLLQDATGAPLTGDHPIQVRLWNAATPGTTPLCETQSTQTLSAGRFSTALPDACTDAIKGNVDVWVEVAVDGVSLGTTKLGTVPYAVEAGHAVSANAAAGDLDTRIKALETRLGSVSGFRAHKTTNQIVAENAFDTVSFDSVDYDLGGEFTLATSTFSPSSSGYYSIGCLTVWETSTGGPGASGWLNSRVEVNGTTAFQVGFYGDLWTAFRPAHSVVHLNAGDQVVCVAHQESSGASRPVRAPSSFEAVRLPL
jgi:hypothetical protein